MKRTERDQLLQRQREIIMENEAFLRSKDYIGTKIAMGVAKKTDYAKEIADTEIARLHIREAEAEVQHLEAIDTFEDEIKEGHLREELPKP